MMSNWKLLPDVDIDGDAPLTGVKRTSFDPPLFAPQNDSVMEILRTRDDHVYERMFLQATTSTWDSRNTDPVEPEAIEEYGVGFPTNDGLKVSNWKRQNDTTGSVSLEIGNGHGSIDTATVDADDPDSRDALPIVGFSIGVIESSGVILLDNEIRIDHQYDIGADKFEVRFRMQGPTAHVRANCNAFITFLELA